MNMVKMGVVLKSAADNDPEIYFSATAKHKNGRPIFNKLTITISAMPRACQWYFGLRKYSMPQNMTEAMINLKVVTVNGGIKVVAVSIAAIVRLAKKPINRISPIFFTNDRPKKGLFLELALFGQV